MLSLTPQIARERPDLVQGSLERLNESLAVYRELGDERGIANALWAMGSNRILVDDWDAAEDDLRNALAIFRSVGNRLMTGWALFELGITQLRQDRFEDARQFLADALTMFEEADDRSGIVLLLDAIASLETAIGEPERGARLAGAAEGVRQTSGVELGELTRRYASYADPRDRLDPATAAKLVAEGRRMSLPDAIAYALRKR